MSVLFLRVVNLAIAAGWLVLAVLVLRLLLKKAPKWTRLLLWAVVALRLLCPVSVETVWSLLPSAETVPLDIERAAAPAIASGVTPSVISPSAMGARLMSERTRPFSVRLSTRVEMPSLFFRKLKLTCGVMICCSLTGMVLVERWIAILTVILPR